MNYNATQEFLERYLRKFVGHPSSPPSLEVMSEREEDQVLENLFRATKPERQYQFRPENGKV